MAHKYAAVVAAGLWASGWRLAARGACGHGHQDDTVTTASSSSEISLMTESSSGILVKPQPCLAAYDTTDHQLLQRIEATHYAVAAEAVATKSTRAVSRGPLVGLNICTLDACAQQAF